MLEFLVTPASKTLLFCGATVVAVVCVLVVVAFIRHIAIGFIVCTFGEIYGVIDEVLARALAFGVDDCERKDPPVPLVWCLSLIAAVAVVAAVVFIVASLVLACKYIMPF